DLCRRDLAVFVVACQRAGLRDDCVAAGGGSVIGPGVHRHFDGMEAVLAGYDLAFGLVGLADLELEAAALEIGVEALDAFDRPGRLCLLLARHAVSPFDGDTFSTAKQTAQAENSVGLNFFR